ncbi:3-oxoacyl-[acyl-carrier-protein] synthase III C-terminal domain-containing protein [Aporhodopirellula aestuarii]|uniref:3-oxoacyl-ACP synthase n=1 Tax=Aporhodopirellula aestuarii TaxID=2950107 RepID=A0ABT0U9B8_9BACT|nr:3-oxoacyl-[acyl-carrier-protein] synthase III C-terminal domain-containing protein [Aporhodopirellula aestuarii]MCM2373284.1 3-oxoacyl-ACP synthase [Aporhodopirellula aestuarii]
MNIFHSILESVGTYLPPQIVTTREILDGCVRPVRVPLERLTGIRSRHFAREDEFAIDLASNAITDCLKHSRIRANQFDLLISANISRWDGPSRVGYEPSTAIALKQLMGFDKAIAFDISNACASMWTAVYVADAFIQSGAVRSALVVSGEYISHLTRTAQLEMEGYLDPQLASLTLGDAGVAVAMCASPRRGEGFTNFDMYTLGHYSRLCIAKPSDQPHGGAVMHTDAVKVTAAIVPHAAAHAVHVLKQTGQHVNDVQHIIPHQTSRLTIRGAIEEIAKQFQTDCTDQMIDNLELRGNTASTTHFLAFRDNIDNGRIRTGDKLLFAISGSGQTSGTAVYNCNDLPDRIRRTSENGHGHSTNGHAAETGSEFNPDESVSVAMSTPFRFESIATAVPHNGERADTLSMLLQAAKDSIALADIDQSTIELLISTGVYRSEFLTEPALAALLAGDLELNADQAATDPVKTFAFDLLNGSIGFLNACHLICEMGRAGRIERAMVVASEIENNADVDGQPTLGITEMASAAILSESEDGETGFHAFRFDHYPQFQDQYKVFANIENKIGKPFLEHSIASDWKHTLIPSIKQSVDQFLSDQSLETESIDWWLPPQTCDEFLRCLADTLGISQDRMIVGKDRGPDAFTSSTPLAMLAAGVFGDGEQRNGDRRAQPTTGDLGLIVNIGSGMQVACALYRF